MKRVLIALVSLVVLAGVALLGRYVLWPERLDTKLIQNLDVDLSLKGVNLSQGRDGKKLWNLQAAGAVYAESGDELTLADPVITYWGEDGGEVIEAMAPRGQVWQKEDRARMWDGVNATHGQYRRRQGRCKSDQHWKKYGLKNEESKSKCGTGSRKPRGLVSVHLRHIKRRKARQALVHVFRRGQGRIKPLRGN